MKLKREVAIKVLPAEWARDPEINSLTENAATAPITVVLNWAGAKK